MWGIEDPGLELPTLYTIVLVLQPLNYSRNLLAERELSLDTKDPKSVYERIINALRQKQW